MSESLIFEKKQNLVEFMVIEIIKKRTNIELKYINYISSEFQKREEVRMMKRPY